MGEFRPVFSLSLLTKRESLLDLTSPLSSKDSFKTLVHPSGQTFCLSSTSLG